jgi:hypothetical protein
MSSTQRSRLATVCALLNAADARYAIIGGNAVELHGLVRATRDVDILIEPTIENAERTLAALSQLPFKIANDVLPEELLSNAVTIIGDTPQVDVLTLAWSVRYADARATLLTTELEGVTIPYVDIDTLIRSKRTGRLQDSADIEALERIKTLRGR